MVMWKTGSCCFKYELKLFAGDTNLFSLRCTLYFSVRLFLFGLTPKIRNTENILKIYRKYTANILQIYCKHTANILQILAVRMYRLLDSDEPTTTCMWMQLFQWGNLKNVTYVILLLFWIIY